MPSKVLLKYGGTYIHTSKNYLLRKTYHIHQKCSSKSGRDREKWLAKSGPPPRKKRTDAMPTKVILKYGATYIHTHILEATTYNIQHTPVPRPQKRDREKEDRKNGTAKNGTATNANANAEMLIRLL